MYHQPIIDKMIERRLQNKTLAPSKHIALFVETNTDRRFSYGINSDRELYRGCCYGEHAETAALKKLPPNHDKKIRYVDLIVIRVKNSKKLASSKPCSKCIQHLSNIRGYIVKTVYYSNRYGGITEMKLTDLVDDSNKHISARFRKKY